MDAHISFDSHHEKPRRVLIVEDHRELAEIYTVFFEMSGFVVTVENNPLNALQLAGRENFEAFLIDVGLDSISGIELARRLRKIPKSRSAVLVAVTGLGRGYHHACISAGFDEFFTKPADMAHIVKVLKDRLAV